MTMTLGSTGLRSRRALLAGAIGALGTAAAATIVGAQRVLGADSDGEPVVIGGDYPDVRSTTTFRSSTDVAGGQPGFRFRAQAPDDSHNRQATISPTGIILRAEHIVSGGRGTTLTPDGIAVSGGKWGGTGVSAEMTGGPAIVGWSSVDVGVQGTGSTGVHGDGKGAGVGVRGQSALGRGGRFKGKKAQIKLDPSAATNHPSSGARGDFFVDMSVRLRFCRGDRDWVRLA